jgi:hypothetical protein
VADITVSPEGVRDGPCPRCGGRAHVAAGRVDRDGDLYARYLLDWCESAPERRVVATLSVGDWSESATPADRSCVAIDMRLEGWRLLDEPHRPEMKDLGPFVPDAEVRRRGAVEQVRSIARIVLAEDSDAARANSWLLGERNSAPGGEEQA